MRSGAFLLIFAATVASVHADDGTASVSGNPFRDGRLALLGVVALSLTTVGLAIDLAIRLRMERHVPSDLADEMERECRALRLSEALHLAEQPANAGVLASAVWGGLARTRRPDATHEAVHRAAEDEGARAVERLDRRINWLGAIGGSAPLLGLIGTVQGVIDGATELATRGNTSRAADLAVVVARSLGPTLWGLVVALIAGLAVAWLRDRLNAIADEAARRAELILEPVGRTS
jgi:biopolymer transport protein ExbB